MSTIKYLSRRLFGLVGFFFVDTRSRDVVYVGVNSKIKSQDCREMKR